MQKPRVRDLFDATPPNDQGTERIIISMLIMAPTRSESKRIRSEAVLDDFHAWPYRVFFRSIMRGYERSIRFRRTMDFMGWFHRDGIVDRLGDSGGPEYHSDWMYSLEWYYDAREKVSPYTMHLLDLFQAFWLFGHIDYYLARLKELSARRRIRRCGGELIKTAFGDEVGIGVARVREQLGDCLDTLGKRA